jgi:hypothetical protein
MKRSLSVLLFTSFLLISIQAVATTVEDLFPLVGCWTAHDEDGQAITESWSQPQSKIMPKVISGSSQTKDKTNILIEHGSLEATQTPGANPQVILVAVFPGHPTNTFVASVTKKNFPQGQGVEVIFSALNSPILHSMVYTLIGNSLNIRYIGSAGGNPFDFNYEFTRGLCH